MSESRREYADRARSLDSIVQLHIAEYNSITNRNTNWSSIQLAIWTLIVLYLTVAASFWSVKKDKETEFYIVWGSAVVIQLALAGWYWVTQEIYRNSCYLHNDLRSKVQSVIGEESFWEYESFIAKSKSPLWTDTAPAACCIAAIIFTAGIRHVFAANAEVKALLVNLPFTGFLIWQTIITVNLRKALEARPKKTHQSLKHLNQ